MKTLWQKKSIPALETETLEMPEALSGADAAHFIGSGCGTARHWLRDWRGDFCADRTCGSGFCRAIDHAFLCARRIGLRAFRPVLCRDGLGATTVAIGWSGYAGSILRNFGIVLPERWSESPFVYDAVAGWSRTGAWLNVPAMLIVAAATLLLTLGVQESTRVNNWMV